MIYRVSKTSVKLKTVFKLLVKITFLSSKFKTVEETYGLVGGLSALTRSQFRRTPSPPEIETLSSQSHDLGYLSKRRQQQAHGRLIQHFPGRGVLTSQWKIVYKIEVDRFRVLSLFFVYRTTSKELAQFIGKRATTALKAF